MSRLRLRSGFTKQINTKQPPCEVVQQLRLTPSLVSPIPGCKHWLHTCCDKHLPDKDTLAIDLYRGFNEYN